MGKIFVYLKNFDWLIFISVVFLALFGLIEIYSIAMGQETANLLNFQKQISFIIIGIASLFTLAFLDNNFLKSSGKYLYLLGAGGLILVLFFGQVIRGAKSWFVFGNFSLQPAEFVKIILIIFLASFFSAKATKIRTVKQLLLSGTAVFLFIFLILFQPDMGAAIIIASVWLFMLVITGFGKKIFLILFFIALLTFGGMWNFYFKDYQKQRILTFFNPDLTSLDQGYNVSQAIIAVGAGGLSGKGIGFGSQSQLKFLPEAQNDFIFAVIAEEFGFFGVFIVLLLFLIIFWRCLSAIKKINNDFGIFFILGGLGLIFIEMFINISMNMGIMPVVGISLPFISYGGSSIIPRFMLIGIMQNIIIKSKINY